MTIVFVIGLLQVSGSSALDATGILGARETLASGADSSENISGANPEVRQSGDRLNARLQGIPAWVRGGTLRGAGATRESRSLGVRPPSESGSLGDRALGRLEQRGSAFPKRLAGTPWISSSDAGFARTVIRSPVAEVARAGGNTPAASDYIEGGTDRVEADREVRGLRPQMGRQRSARSPDVSQVLLFRSSGRGNQRCRQNRRGLAHYYAALESWRLKMERGVTAKAETLEAVAAELPRGEPRRPRSCNWVRRVVQLVRSRAQKARERYQAWHAAQWVLREQRTWRAAVEHVQRAYPGTAGWLMSCSAAEGGWGRWVGYGGQSYSTGLRDSDTVGGPMQFRFSTFTGMYRRSVEHARSRGYRITLGSDLTAAWRSYLGQALAAGWARWSGNDNSHWSASWSRGC